MKERNRWSDEELRILRNYYPIEGDNIVKRLTSKSLDSIHRKCRQILICYSKPWNSDEISRLRSGYLQIGKEIFSRIEGHSSYECKCKFKELGMDIYDGLSHEECELFEELLYWCLPPSEFKSYKPNDIMECSVSLIRH